MSSTPNAPNFSIQNIYLKGIGFDAPNSPQIFNTDGKSPKIEFNLELSNQVLSEKHNIHELTIHISAFAKIGEGDAVKDVFKIDIVQAGSFLIEGYSGEALTRILDTKCATILFSFVRDMIATLAFRGGFPQLMIPFVDFDVMYDARIAEEKKAQ